MILFNVLFFSIFLYKAQVDCKEMLVKTSMEQSDKSQLSEAIQNYMLNFFAAETSEMYLEIRPQNGYIGEMFLKSSARASLTYQINGLQYYQGSPYFVFIIESFQDFMPLLSIIKKRPELHNVYILIVLLRNTSSANTDISNIFNSSWRASLVNVDILVAKGNNIVQAYTYKLFEENRCGLVSVVVLKGHIFPQKLKNFHQCPLRAALWIIPPYMYIDHSKSGLERFAGLDGYVLRELARLMNFSIILVEAMDGRGQVFANGSTTGAFQLVKSGAADFTIGNIRCLELRNKEFSATNSYYMTYVGIIMKTTNPYTSFEVLQYPFGRRTWLVLSVFSITCVIILGASQVPFSLINAIMVIYQAALGQSFGRVPRMFVIKSILMNWCIATMILRTAYQAAWYHLIATNVTHPQPKDLQDVLLQKYRFIMHPSIDVIVKDFLPELGHRSSPLNTTDADVFYVLDRETDRVAVLSIIDFFILYKRVEGADNMFAVPEWLFNEQDCIYSRKHTVLTARFNELLILLRSQGFLQKWDREFISGYVQKLPKDATSNQPKPMSFNKLSAIFQILGGGLVLAGVVFAAEMLSTY